MSNKKENNNGNNKNSQNLEGVIIMGIYMHCQGCADMVSKSLRGFEGVEEIETDLKNHKVTVKGKKADPKKVFDRLQKKTGKHVTLISPKLKDKKEEKNEPKKQEPKVVEVVLKIYMHCQGCAEDIECCIHKMKGVQIVTTDLKNSTVTVKGTFEAVKLVEFIKKKTDKHVTIVKQTQAAKDASAVKQTPPTENKKGQKNEKDGGKLDLQTYYQIYPPGLVYAPQIFSDENPNACSIM